MRNVGRNLCQFLKKIRSRLKLSSVQTGTNCYKLVRGRLATVTKPAHCRYVIPGDGSFHSPTYHQQAFLCSPAPDGSPSNGDSEAEVQTSSLFLQTESGWTGIAARSWLWGPPTLSWTVCFPESKTRSSFLKVTFSFLECHRGPRWEGSTTRALHCSAPLRRTAVPTVQRRPLAALTPTHIGGVPALGQPLVDTS